MNYNGKKIVIFGLGSYKNGSGISTAVFLAKHGAKLLVTDLRNRKELALQLKRLKKYKNIEYVLGRHRKSDFKNADFVVKNPGVLKHSPYLKTARDNKIPIINDWSIFFDERPDNLVIGITGTKGKSVTASMIYHVLKTTGKNTVLCGNIGKSPLALLSKIKKGTIVVAELSSWLLADFKQSPQIAVVTNLMPDHLDKYKNLKEYYKDKENIFKFQKPDDHLIKNEQGDEATYEVAKILKIPKTIVKKALKTFKGVSGRLEFIKKKGGVSYYNDTTATMPEATIYALKSLKKHEGRTCPERSRRIILIAGGMDKKLNYKNLAHEIPKYCKALILFEGTASEKIANELKCFKFQVSSFKNSMRHAVETAQKLATKNDIILLSPGSASFNLFKNEFDRGKQFVKEIKKK